MDGAVIVSLFPSLFLGFLFTPITAPWSRTVFISLRSLTTVRASATLRVPFRYASLHLRYATDFLSVLFTIPPVLCSSLRTPLRGRRSRWELEQRPPRRAGTGGMEGAENRGSYRGKE